jgi:coenzyme F420-reducing hydrogenase delta subunit
MLKVWGRGPRSGICAMKRPETLIKELRPELQYWQERVRIDTWSLQESRRMAKKYGAKMRALQAEVKARKKKKK